MATQTNASKNVSGDWSRDLIPASKYSSKAPHAMKPVGICLHNTANSAPAANEISYMKSNPKATSYHMAVDENQAIQAIPFDRNGWHAGDGNNGSGNRKHIGIEIARSTNYNGNLFQQSEKRAAAVCAKLCGQYGWGTSQIKAHRDFSGKNCPHRTNMTSFRNLVASAMGKGGTSTPSSSPSFSIANAVKANNQLGYSKDKWKHIQAVVGTTVDGDPGQKTAQQVGAFQAKHGLVVDGVAGPVTCKKIASIKAFPGTPAAKAPAAKAPAVTKPTPSFSIAKAVEYNKKMGYSKDKWKHIQAVVGTTADGDPGQKTAQQVGAFQAKHGLVVDGVAGPVTCKKIASIKAFPGTPAAKAPAAKAPAVTKPTPSFSIAKAVEYNKKMGYSKDKWKHIQAVVGTTADGDPGQKTAQQVGAFQAKHGLVVDGVAGPVTCKKIASIKAFPKAAPQSAPPTGGSIQRLSTKEVARRESGRKAKKVVDLTTKRTFNVSWDACATYHTDFTPMTASDTSVIKGFLSSTSPSNKSYWSQKSSWSWNARPAAIQLKDGTWVACGYHTRPHAAIMGGNPGHPLVNKSNTRPASGWAIGGHMCMYYGDSPGGTPKCNDAAKKASTMKL